MMAVIGIFIKAAMHAVIPSTSITEWNCPESPNITVSSFSINVASNAPMASNGINIPPVIRFVLAHSVSVVLIAKISNKAMMVMFPSNRDMITSCPVDI